MIQFATFPRTWSPPVWVGRIVEVFRRHQGSMSPDQSDAKRSSGELLAVIASDLEGLGFHIEKLTPTDRKVPRRPFAAGEPAEQYYNVDVYHPQWHCCIAIEDGPARSTDAIDGDGVEPLLVANADTLCLAIPASARGSGSATAAQRLPDSEYDRALALAQVLYGRSRSYLPHRLVLIGY